MKTSAERQARSRKARAEAGGRQLSVMLPRDAAKALEKLTAKHGGVTAAVGYALKLAGKKA